MVSDADFNFAWCLEQVTKLKANYLPFKQKQKVKHTFSQNVFKNHVVLELSKETQTFILYPSEVS